MSKTNQIRSLKKHIKIEVSKYHKTKDTTYLVQAGEKTWMAYVLYIQKLSGEEALIYGEIKKTSEDLIKKKKIKRELFERALALHTFHYGWVGDPEIVNNYIHYCLKKIK